VSRLTTPFGPDSTAREVLVGVDLTGQRAIVTGGASGIGIETARELARAGAEVTIAARKIAEAEVVAEEIAVTTGNARVDVRPLDLAVRASIHDFVAAWQGPLHILVNNAGVMATPETRTTDGWELQFATNHLGHFALAAGLRASLASAGNARIVSVSSRGHLRSPVVFDDIDFDRRLYDPWLAYGQSKTANVLFAVEVTKRWASNGITANAVMPGVIHTPLMRYLSSADIDLIVRQGGGDAFRWKTPEQGAATSVLLAASPLLDGVGGRYFEHCNEAVINVPPDRNGVALYALDADNAARLWETSERILGIRA
jgi:NAD(P)-dependent dehydrogenase (short-subunit alcohol dehydrogenase family)